MEIVENVSKLNKGIFGVTIVTETTPSMNKTNNPYIGRVKKVSTYTNAILGISYQNRINNKLSAKGMDSDFVSQAPRGKKHYNSFFYISLDESKFYLKIGQYANTKIHSTYFVDGVEATESQVAEIKSFLTKKTTYVATQAAAGLDESEQYHITAPLADNVVSITIGEKIIYQRP